MSSSQETAKTRDSDQETKELSCLLKLVQIPVSKKKPPTINDENKENNQWPLPQPKSGAHPSTEALALEQFSTRHQNERNFSCHSQHKRFSQLFSALVKNRLCLEWINQASPENILQVLTCLRIMMRDLSYQKSFFELGGVKVLSEHLKKATDSYLQYGQGPYVVDILSQMTIIFQKLSTVVKQREWLIACSTHNPLLLLLSANDVIVLHCALHALIGLAQSERPRQKIGELIGELNYLEMILRIIQEYHNLSKKLAVHLLQLLCQDSQSRELVKLYDGVPILLSQLHSDNVNFLKHVAWCLVELCKDGDISKDVRQMGGIPIILALLHDRKFVTERSDSSECPVSAGPYGRSPAAVDEGIWDFGMCPKQTRSKSEEINEQQYSVKSACCAALTELVCNDTNAQQIVQANGVYSLGLLILPPSTPCTSRERKEAEALQRQAFRALRFLFSMERNRSLFKRLFPPGLYEKFIDAGQYNKNLKDYKPLVDMINSLPGEAVEEIRGKVCMTNQNKAPDWHCGEYAVFEMLGRGSFGSVYKVKKKNGQTFHAMKEIDLKDPAYGQNSKERDVSVGEIKNEVAIIREQLKHPNVVRYHKTFVQDDKLYIVMDLIEGATLDEHFNSLIEKKEKFPEERIWNIFMQMVLALRYLHKEKRIVHRDLTPKNVMLGENDKVTITDFGLSKQRRVDCSKLTSVVGTFNYSCPEIVENKPYGEKADIWALGCILYQMCTLKPPFSGINSNILQIARKIVEAEYEPIPGGDYSSRLRQTVDSCICACPDKRPDILQVSSQLVDILLRHIDGLHVQKHSFEKKLERERKRTQKHFVEANRNQQKYHSLFLVSKERYDKLANLAGSGGASALKDADVNDSAFLDDNVTSLSSNGVLQDGEDQDRGLSSDDESYPSSGNESRESSAGSTRSGGQSNSIRRLLPPPTPKTIKQRLGQDPYCQLSLDIPNGAKYPRDSGFSSGDPSPNSISPSAATSVMDPSISGLIEGERQFHRSLSSPSVNSIPQSLKKKATKRTTSAATLTISQRRVRQISDPILQMLHPLHKIIYIAQLPPTLCPNPHRRIIEQFKRALFNQQSNTFNLKSELQKLVVGSKEIIDLTLRPIDYHPFGSTNSDSSDSASSPGVDKMVTSVQYDPDFKEVGITYEQMQSMIESVLNKCGYYKMATNTRERTPPLGPIGTDPHTYRHSSGYES